MIVKGLLMRMKRGVPYMVGFVLMTLMLPLSHWWQAYSRIEDYELKGSINDTDQGQRCVVYCLHLTDLLGRNFRLNEKS
jgi:hypothetical protein